MNTRTPPRNIRALRPHLALPLLAALCLLLSLTASPVAADPHWFSGPARQGSKGGPGTDNGSTPFDITISLHSNPQGDNNGNTQGADPASADQDTIEHIVQHMADGVFEATEGAHALRNVRIYREGQNASTADVVWAAAGHPCAHINGITDAGLHIYKFDTFTGGAGGGADYNLLADEVGAGYTLAHEWGHYAYGLKDEYRLQAGDVPVVPALMNRSRPPSPASRPGAARPSEPEPTSPWRA